MGRAGVGWREGEKMQTIVTEFKKKKKKTQSKFQLSAQGQEFLLLATAPACLLPGVRGQRGRGIATQGLGVEGGNLLTN